MNEKTHIDLFSGIGGFALAAQANGIKTVAFCESDPRCRDFLAKAWPGIPCHPNIKTFGGAQYRGATWLLTGGVPCQPASRAGKQRGAGDDRWLWPEALRVLSEVKPAWVLFESPPGIEDVGLDGILVDVEGKGYEVGPIFDIPACAVDAPHLRHRYWIVGHSKKTVGDDKRRGKIRPPGASTESGNAIRAGNVSDSGGASVQQAAAGRTRKARGVAAARTGQGDVSDADKSGRRRRSGKSGTGRRGKSADKSFWSDHAWAAFPDGKVRRTPGNSVGVVDGLHRSILGALGNSIVWQVAAKIIAAMKEAEA